MIIFSVETYSPDEPEERAPSSTYLTKKDVKWLLLILIVVTAAMIPIYEHFKEDRNEHLCKQNIREISKSMGLYALEHDDRIIDYDADRQNQAEQQIGRAHV